QSRFETMQKVGMTRKQISKSINSQMLTVFLIPIVFACIHIGVILPIINKLLMLFGLFNMPHLVLCTAVCAVICGLFYGVIYKITSNAYLRIVTNIQ
ncbi:MAG: ABC transporter permease, partial [Firmicutes bacterium]|nr:ABC transporter permease [Bacillota bacterium]